MLRPGIIARDRHFQYIQLAITKASCTLSVLADSYLGQNSPSEVKDIVTTLTDSMALLGHAHVQLSYRRRDAMVPALKGVYSGLSSTEVPITDKLFGDDIVKTMAEVKKEKSVQLDAKSYSYQQPKLQQRPQRAANEISTISQQRENPVSKEKEKPLPELLEVTPKVSANLGFHTFVDETVQRNTLKRDHFQAGRLKHFIHAWRKITSDPIILKALHGFEISFIFYLSLVTAYFE